MNMNGENVVRSGENRDRWRKVIKKVREWFSHKNNDEWLKDMRGVLSLVATVIATLTFQVALNPPGGVRPASELGDITCPVKNETNTNTCPGEAVLATTKIDAYILFLSANTTCFISSLAICLLLVSGLPLNNRFCTWLFSIGMCIILTTLTLTYIIGALMIVPYSIVVEESVIRVLGLAIFIWFILLIVIALCLTIRLIVWITAKCIDKPTRSTSVD